jgi:hypothetical protein
MTFENKCWIEPEDIRAVQIECSKCHYRSVRLVEGWLQDSISCANCGQIWFLAGSGDLTRLKELVGSLRAISELTKKQDGLPFGIKFEIKCQDGK